mmetsp:Transcript_18077/g.29945  ORF Transcript_18077/g.29945 Transcript_18077/m.29945 type:complete len:259 (-) Transcript_18077:377-1153(-)
MSVISTSLSSLLFFCFNLSLDPHVGLLQTIINRNGWFPSKFGLDEDIVGIASTNAHGTFNVLNGQFLVFKGQGNGRKLNHIDHFGRSQIDWHIAIGKGESQDPLDTIINEREGSCLFTIAPHFEMFGGRQCLATKGCGCLFTASLPGSTRTVNVMKTGNANLHGKIATVGESHFFSVQLFQSVHILRTGRPRISFHQTRIGWIFLFGFIVDTGGRSVKESLHIMTSGTFQHVHGNGSIVKGQNTFIGTNESHSTHISC